MSTNIANAKSDIKTELMNVIRGAFMEFVLSRKFLGISPGKKIAGIMFDEYFKEIIEWRINNVLKKYEFYTK